MTTINVSSVLPNSVTFNKNVYVTDEKGMKIVAGVEKKIIIEGTNPYQKRVGLAVPQVMTPIDAADWEWIKTEYAHCNYIKEKQIYAGKNDNETIARMTDSETLEKKHGLERIKSSDLKSGLVVNKNPTI